MKLCKDCKWCELDGEFSVCLKPMGVDLVTGEALLHSGYCDLLRDDGWLCARVLGVCGKEGRWFEAK